LFHRADMVQETWRVVQPVLDAWAANGADLASYASGSVGPAAGDELIARDGGRAWRPASHEAAVSHATEVKP
jgi:glucose-6-phosphate 1-dehydrogenase